MEGGVRIFMFMLGFGMQLFPSIEFVKRLRCCASNHRAFINGKGELVTFTNGDVIGSILEDLRNRERGP